MTEVLSLSERSRYTGALSDLVKRIQTADNTQGDLKHLPKSFSPVYRKELPRIYTNTRWFGLRRTGRIFELETRLDSESLGNNGGGLRGMVYGFSWESRRRLLKAIAAIPWAVLGEKWFVTLTYPALFPADGPTCKAHLKAFRKRLVRRYGKQMALVWKMEFQKRGAVHFHLLMQKPSGLFLDGVGRKDSLQQFQAWCSEAWASIVAPWHVAAGGSEQDRDNHLLAGTSVQESSSDCGRYFAYVLKEKEVQNSVPDGFEDPGRFWGIWGFRPEWSGVLLSRDEYVQLRRTIIKWQKSKGFVRDAEGHLWRKAGHYAPKVRGRFTSTWYLTDDRSGFLVLAQLVRALPGRDLLPLLT
jgi:hypothetical protein